MNHWINDRGCHIYLDKNVPIDEHGDETGKGTFSWWCACNRSQVDYESLPDCVRDARAHIEE
ncbi:MAG: hypothetical protein OXD50_01715 [Chloroflexi bacterium]|nr:hypothetical protein [Chloroflexota bacterium]